MTQYSEKSYKMASDNTKYNDDGKAVISENDEWRDEKEWDEVFEQMQKYHVPCTMRTGQECIEEAGSRVTACTIEMADYDENYDIAVIDEAQLVADVDRGHSWTKAILGLRAKEIHICMSPAAEQVICHLIELCGDDNEVDRY